MSSPQKNNISKNDPQRLQKSEGMADASTKKELSDFLSCTLPDDTAEAKVHVPGSFQIRFFLIDCTPFTPKAWSYL